MISWCSRRSISAFMWTCDLNWVPQTELFWWVTIFVYFLFLRWRDSAMSVGPTVHKPWGKWVSGITGMIEKKKKKKKKKKKELAGCKLYQCDIFYNKRQMDCLDIVFGRLQWETDGYILNNGTPSTQNFGTTCYLSRKAMPVPGSEYYM